MATVSSSTSTTTSTSVEFSKVWLKNPQDASMNRALLTETRWLEMDKNKQRSLVRGLGRKLPVVLRGISGGESFSAWFLCEGQTAFDDLLRLIDADVTLLLQIPRRQWYVEVSGDPDVNELVWDLTEEPVRRVRVPFQEVAAP